MPDREEDEEVRRPGELEAKLASSRESRAWDWRFDKGRDMVFRASRPHALGSG